MSAHDLPGKADTEREAFESLRSQLGAALQPDFDLLRPLGSGKTGHVFLARETALRRLVAVKVLRPEVGNRENARARFEREAHSAAGISHPCVPAVYRVGRLANGLPFLIQEYLEGRTLRDRLEATGALEPREARPILADLAGALAASHAQGVIHRDVRPENVILDRKKDRAVLMDFGIAAVRETGSHISTRITQTGEILGDPDYASPEQLYGENVTPGADIYSLGVLGYEVLSLKNPLTQDVGEDPGRKEGRARPLDLPWQVTSEDPDLAHVLKRCLNEDPARRPRAEELRTAFSQTIKPAGHASHGHGHGHAGAGSIFSAFPRLAGFVGELRRRRVYQVAGAYVLGGLILLEGSDLVLSGLGAPPWVYSTVVAVAVAGFPVILALSWAFDVTPAGIRRTEPVEGGGGGSRAFRIAGLIGSILLAGLIGWLLLS